ncbi:alpha/beta hydrolase family protein [Bifidobacterium sp.]|uniref:alpha/beta hydrolase family protein n=1 Tax=Bifidobacterium sp. TaxID=41200 RepID=UPI0025C3CD5D|nr:alpha/beta hydrolase [Bifidobacterium sp.]MCH4209580.1 alpha/beta hydrolase [Bifidobacterium sp.]MCI1225021.1 alpha/beta hydrolase [Bifidobacterium sp.]
MKRISSIAAASVVLLVLCALLGAAMTPNWRVDPLADAADASDSSGAADSAKNDGSDGRITVKSSDTAIAARGLHTSQEGRYKVKETHLRIRLTASVNIHALLREPVGAAGKRPGCLFLHGAGTGKASAVYGDLSWAMASAGIVTLVPDKRIDNYTTFQRDYPGMARDYATSLAVLKSRGNVDASRVGLYAESEGTWIASIMARDHPDLAFMILTSPPVVPGRRQMAMAASNYMTTIGAPRPMVQDVSKFIGMDFSMLGLHYADFPAERYLNALTMPLLVNYGTEDLSMPIEQGAAMLRAAAHSVGNDNVTVRYYSANHQMRVGARTSKPGLPLDRHYTHNLEDWINAVASEPVSGAGTSDTAVSGGNVSGTSVSGTSPIGWSTPMIAGTQPHQRLAVPQTTTPGLVRSLQALLVLLAMAPLCLLVGIIGSLVLTLAGLRRRKQGRGGSFGTGIAGLLAANAIAVVASTAGLLAYLSKLVSDTLVLRDDAATLSTGWMALRALAVLSVVVFAWLLVRLGENRLILPASHTPEHLHTGTQNSQDSPSVAMPSGTTPVATPTVVKAAVAASGFGHRLVFASLTISATFSLASLAFWGLFAM